MNSSGDVNGVTGAFLLRIDGKTLQQGEPRLISTQIPFAISALRPPSGGRPGFIALDTESGRSFKRNVHMLNGEAISMPFNFHPELAVNPLKGLEFLSNGGLFGYGGNGDNGVWTRVDGSWQNATPDPHGFELSAPVGNDTFVLISKTRSATGNDSLLIYKYPDGLVGNMFELPPRDGAGVSILKCFADQKCLAAGPGFIAEFQVGARALRISSVA